MKIKRIISLILTVALMLLALTALTSCGSGGAHWGERSTEGRTLRYAKITVKDYGDIIVLLEESTAPKTVASFLSLAERGYYDGLTFHRVMADFMIQGGAPNSTEKEIMLDYVPGEFALNGFYNDLSHLRGTISLARANDPNSGSGQFFINNVDYPYLDGSYAAFGYVIAGMNVVDEITENTAKYGNYNGVINDVSKQAVIESVREITEDEALKIAK
ncbi:MAG: peptidylprolyl isomerase [Clostridia bacterium]|nr:peptidylprolyl isomerase [Clostridia bacterium]